MSGNVSIHGVSSSETLTNGKVKWIAIQVDADGNLRVVDQTAHAGEPGSGTFLDALGYWIPVAVNASGVNVVYTGACLYGGYIIATAAGAGLTMDIYDNTAASGLKYASAVDINTKANNVFASGVYMANGICANTSGNPTDDCVFVLYKAI